MIDALGRTVELRKLIRESKGRVAAKNYLAQWRNYSFITFIDRTNLPEKIAPNSPQQDEEACVIQ